MSIPPARRQGHESALPVRVSTALAAGRAAIFMSSRTCRHHPKFERKGDDLVEEVSVPVEDAVLGGEVEVPTISGKRVAMKIPAMTQSGRQIKLKGLGMPNLNGKDKGCSRE